MNPLVIEMLLFVYCQRETYDDRGGSAQRDALKWLLREGLVEPTIDGAVVFGVPFRTTERGNVLVYKLCHTVLPVAKWV